MFGDTLHIVCKPKQNKVWYIEADRSHSGAITDSIYHVPGVRSCDKYLIGLGNMCDLAGKHFVKRWQVCSLVMTCRLNTQTTASPFNFGLSNQHQHCYQAVNTTSLKSFSSVFPAIFNAHTLTSSKRHRNYRNKINTLYLSAGRSIWWLMRRSDSAIRARW